MPLYFSQENTRINLDTLAFTYLLFIILGDAAGREGRVLCEIPVVFTDALLGPVIAEEKGDSLSVPQRCE